MNFDWTVTLGNVLTLIGMLVGGFSIVWSMRTDILLLRQRVEGMEKTVDKLGDIATSSAKQESRLNVFDERLTSISSRIENLSIRVDRGERSPYMRYSEDDNGRKPR